MYTRQNPTTYTCPQCQMLFSTISQLALHREKFCLKKSYNSQLPTRPPANSLSGWNTKLLADKKIQQLHELKEVGRLRSKEGELRDQLLLHQSSPLKPLRYQDTYYNRGLYDRQNDIVGRGSAYSYPGDNHQVRNTLRKPVMDYPDDYYYSRKMDSLRRQEDMLKKTLQEVESRISQLHGRKTHRLLPLRNRRQPEYFSTTDDEAYESAPEHHYTDNLQRSRIEDLEAQIKSLKRQSKVPSYPSPRQPRHTDYYSEPDPGIGISRRIPSIACPSKYDEGHGFTIFYDFVLGLESDTKRCQLVVGMYDGGIEMGEPSVLPSTSSNLSQGGCTAVIWSQQNFPGCPPLSRINIVIELQASNSKSGHMRTKGWLSLQLFTNRNYLRSGSWRIPFLYPPINTGVPMMETMELPQYANAAMYVRVVNHIDCESQALLAVSPANNKHYDDPFLVREFDL